MAMARRVRAVIEGQNRIFCVPAGSRTVADVAATLRILLSLTDREEISFHIDGYEMFCEDSIDVIREDDLVSVEVGGATDSKGKKRKRMSSSNRNMDIPSNSAKAKKRKRKSSSAANRGKLQAFPDSNSRSSILMAVDDGPVEKPPPITQRIRTVGGGQLIRFGDDDDDETFAEEKEIEDEISYDETEQCEWKKKYEVLASVNDKSISHMDGNEKLDEAALRYENLPKLPPDLPPSPGDVLAYRLLSLSEETWTPTLSPYLELTVLSHDSAQGTICVRSNDEKQEQNWTMSIKDMAHVKILNGPSLDEVETRKLAMSKWSKELHS